MRRCRREWRVRACLPPRRFRFRSTALAGRPPLRRIAGGPCRRPASRGRCGTAGGAGSRARRPRAAADLLEPRLELLLRAMQFARQLRVEIALPIDVVDERVALLDGRSAAARPLAASARAAAQASGPFARAESARRPARRAAAGARRRDRDRGGPARRPSAPPGRGAGCRTSRAAAAGSGPVRACTVPTSRARSSGAFATAPALEPRDLPRRAPPARAAASASRVALAQFLVLDLRSSSSWRRSPSSVRSRGQPIGFLMQRLQAIGRARARALRSARTIGLLPESAPRQHERAATTRTAEAGFTGRVCEQEIITSASCAFSASTSGAAASGWRSAIRTGTLARPLTTLTVDGRRDGRRRSRGARDRASGRGGRRAVGRSSSACRPGSTARRQRQTAHVARVHRRRLERAHRDSDRSTEDERLTSREAESRLAVDERDWRKRKARLDAAAAAIILQDYLDRDARQVDRLKKVALVALVVLVAVCGAGAAGCVSAVPRGCTRRFAGYAGPEQLVEHSARRRHPRDRPAPDRRRRRPRRADVSARALAERKRARTARPASTGSIAR